MITLQLVAQDNRILFMKILLIRCLKFFLSLNIKTRHINSATQFILRIPEILERRERKRIHWILVFCRISGQRTANTCLDAVQFHVTHRAGVAVLHPPFARVCPHFVKTPFCDKILAKIFSFVAIIGTNEVTMQSLQRALNIRVRVSARKRSLPV